MPNAKLLIELEGVEAGSRECGECTHVDDHGGEPEWPSPVCLNLDLLGGYEDLKIGVNGPLRCPACLRAEEAAKGLGRNPGLDEALNMGDGSYKP